MPHPGNLEILGPFSILSALRMLHSQGSWDSYSFLDSASCYVASSENLLLSKQCYVFFLEIIHSPENTVVFTDGVATFMCDAVNSSDIRWTFNGSLSYQLPTEVNETSVFLLVGDVGQSNLTFQGRAEYNMTVVQCIALLARGGTVRSQTVTLLIQGMYVCIPYIDTIVTTFELSRLSVLMESCIHDRLCPL